MADIVFFFDRTFGKRLPYAIRKCDPPVEIKWHQGEKLPQAMPDDEWLELAGKNSWVVITQDQKLHVRENELLALKQHGVGCFYFPCASETRWISLCNFVATHKRLLQHSLSKARPFVFDVKKNGAIKPVAI